FPVIHQPPQEMSIQDMEDLKQHYYSSEGYYKNSTVAITSDFPVTDSFTIEDEHLDTIPETKSDKLIKSSVENLVPIPKSLLNHDTLIISSPKIDSFPEEFSCELSHIDLIPPGINEADYDPEEEICLIDKLLYDNSSPRPPKDFNSENSDVIIESFSPSPIIVEDNDSLIEEIDLFLTLDDSMPSGIENDDYDSKGDIIFLEELISNDSHSLLKNESFHFDVPSSPRPPAKLPDDGIYFEPDTRVFTIKVVGDISEHYVLMPTLFPTQPTLSLNKEKSPHLLSHRGFKAF
nr:hypothetical protein [Tanacetum cinerariifolium]